MDIRSASIIYWLGKFYIPSNAMSVEGGIISVDPVYIVDPDLTQMEKMIEKVLLAPVPRLPAFTQEEWKKRKDVTLNATGAKSWKELAKKGASYSIAWVANEKQLSISRVDKQGRWEYTRDSIRSFPVDTPLSTIIRIIIDDVNSRESLAHQ